MYDNRVQLIFAKVYDGCPNEVSKYEEDRVPIDHILSPNEVSSTETVLYPIELLAKKFP